MISKPRAIREQIVVFRRVLCAIALAACSSAEAQQVGQMHRVGYLSNSAGAGANPSKEAFRQGMRELGYTEGKNLLIEWRHSNGKLDQLPKLATELVQLNVNCIFSIGVESTRSAKQATSRIPIVMGDADDDPVRQGLVDSLARPGGNVTGFISISSDLASKRIGILKDILPQLSRLAILYPAQSKAAAGHVKESETAARALKLQLKAIPVSDINEINNAFEFARKDRADAMVIVNVAGMGAYQPTLTRLAIKTHLPTMHTQSAPIAEGGLMSYAADVIEIRRRATTYVDKVLRGASPAELPVQQPTKFELVINLKTAKQIGLIIPPNVLARADRVIR